MVTSIVKIEDIIIGTHIRREHKRLLFYHPLNLYINRFFIRGSRRVVPHTKVLMFCLSYQSYTANGTSYIMPLRRTAATTTAVSPLPSPISSHKAASAPPRVLLVDNYDSFTYNIYQMIAKLCGGRPPLVVTNDMPWKDKVEPLVRTADAIVLGPGPGHPEVPADFGICARILDESRAESKEAAILGICLGHQGMASVLGGKVVPAASPMHGRLSTIKHNEKGLFKDVPQKFKAIRYNSLRLWD